MTIDLPSARDLIALYSSLEELEYLYSCLIILKSWFSNWLRNISKQGCPLKRFWVVFFKNAGVSVNSCASTRKYHFERILLQNSLKSCLCFGSFIFRCIGAKSSSFSNILIFAYVNTLWLRLKIVSELRYCVKLLSDGVQLFWKVTLNCFLMPQDLLSDSSERFNKSSSIYNITPSTSLSKFTGLFKNSEELLEVEKSL